MVGTEYCIGPKTVSGNFRAAVANSKSGTAVTTPESKTKMMCQKFADCMTESSYRENQKMSATAGTTRKIVSDIKLSSGCSGTCLFNNPYKAHEAAIAKAM